MADTATHSPGDDPSRRDFIHIAATAAAVGGVAAVAVSLKKIIAGGDIAVAFCPSDDAGAISLQGKDPGGVGG